MSSQTLFCPLSLSGWHPLTTNLHQMDVSFSSSEPLLWHMACSALYWFPRGSAGKESACDAEVQGPIPGSGRSPGEGNDYLLQYYCLENSMDRGALGATVHGVAKSQTWLSESHFNFVFKLCIMPASPLSPGTQLGLHKHSTWTAHTQSPGLKGSSTCLQQPSWTS